jgi:uncharacterized protein YkwD
LKRLLIYSAIIFLIYLSLPLLDEHLESTDYSTVIDSIKSDMDGVKENPSFSAVIDTFNAGIQELAGQIDKTIEQLPKQKQQDDVQNVEKPTLSNPIKQSFSIYNIELGDQKEEIEQKMGSPKRSSFNEYGVEWHTYHENYQNFFMVAYDKNNQVTGLYSNQDLISSIKGIKFGSPKESVLTELGEPLTKIQKGFTFYQLQEDRDYDVFLLDGSYITVFYDKHSNNILTSIQIITKDLEQNKEDFYTQASPQLKEGFELQLFDLTNASRVVRNLSVLSWDDQVKETARKHSEDMAKNNYFNHTNLEGQSPFDRMAEDQITFTVAGENLAYGQFSSIFAHEGLMNSLGHRKNILRPDFDLLGIGVSFNNQSQPYYTENFYTK